MKNISVENKNNIRSLVHLMIDGEIPVDILIAELGMIVQDELGRSGIPENKEPRKLISTDEEHLTAEEVSELLKAYKPYARNLNMIIEKWSDKYLSAQVSHFNDLLSDTELKERLYETEPDLYDTVFYFAVPLQKIASSVNSMMTVTDGKEYLFGDAIFARYIFMPNLAIVDSKENKAVCLKEYHRLAVIHGKMLKGSPQAGYYRNSSDHAIVKLTDELNFKLDIEEIAAFKWMAALAVKYDLTKPSEKILITHTLKDSEIA